jgi:hypothetical protein
MGPESKDRLADVLENLTAAIGSMVTEQKLQRVMLARISARLAIEVDDRIEADSQLGRVQVEHSRKLALVGMGGE